MAQTLFGPARYGKYAQIVSFKTPKEAQSSARQLLREFNSAATHEKRLRVLRVTQYAANRAKAAGNRTNLSSNEKKEYIVIAIIYENMSDLMQDEL